MNPHKQLLRWLVKAQIFTLFILILMPTLLHWLENSYGKWLYSLIILTAMGLAWALHSLLDTVD